MPFCCCFFNGEFAPYASKGYWYNQDEQIYLACIPTSACPGDIGRICADGYRGTRCGECGANYYKLNNQCIPCNSIEPVFITLIAACFVSGFYLLYLFWGLAGKAQGLGIINIACNFIQTTLILRNINMNWPPEIQDILDYFSVFNFNLELSSPECLVQEYLNFSSKMKMTLLIPIVLLGFLIAAMILRSKFVKRVIQIAKAKLFHGLKFSEGLWIRDLQASSSMPRTDGRASAMEIVALFNSSLSLVYITVASYSLSLFDCTKERDGYFYLDADPSLRCYEEWWYDDLDYAVVAIALYVIGIPLYFGIILYFSSNVPFSGRFWVKFKRYCALIFVTDSSYRANGKWFMLVQIFHKLMLVIVAMFFSRYISFQIVLTVLTLMITFFMTLKYQPYTHMNLNYLELYSLGSNIVILNLGFLFYNNQLTPTLKAIAIDVVLAVIASFILAVVFASAYEMKNQFRRLVAKQVSSSNPQIDKSAESDNLTMKTAKIGDRIRNLFGGFSRSGMRTR
ncbi:hypothetical protein BKA69DRAFT_839063 [Paraphysoderma sedebokerense]|nr:hypothetical protein BKA69DRAFT_839063 [Paraphysoderma sedebokerense]